MTTAPATTTTPLARETLSEWLRATLQNWHGSEDEPSLLQSLLLFAEARHAWLGTTRPIHRHLFDQWLRKLQEQHHEAADLLRQRYLEDQSVQAVAYKNHLSESTLYRKQNEAINLLTDLVYAKEVALRQQQQQILLARLEPPTTENTVGLDDALTQLSELLLKPAAPWLVALIGLGGLGKTTLADALLRHLLAQGRLWHLGWVTTRTNLLQIGGTIQTLQQPTLSTAELMRQLDEQLHGSHPTAPSLSDGEVERRLQQRLQQAPHLIVIDNLETLNDIETLLPALRRLSNPSKFLLTSRISLRHEADVFHFDVPTLSANDILRLIRQQALLSNLPAVSQASNEELLPIFEVVGGNPLAVRLVVGQLHMHALHDVLDDLRQARSDPSQNLYTFIYRRAWDLLTQAERETWIAMLLVSPQGGDRQLVQAVTAIAADILWRALDKLVKFNLVDSRGGLNDKRFAIHPLTRTFLHEQVVKWQ